MARRPSSFNGYMITPTGSSRLMCVDQSGNRREISVPPLSRIRVANETRPSVDTGRWPVTPLRSRRTTDASWPVPGAVDPRSIRLHRVDAQGTRHLLQPDVDYELDSGFAGITPRLKADAAADTFSLDYELRLQRVDALAAKDGELRLFAGAESLVCPRWPRLPPGWRAVARIHLRFTDAVDESTIFPVQHAEHARLVNYPVRPGTAARLPGAGGPETVPADCDTPLWTGVIDYGRYVYGSPGALTRLRRKFEASDPFRLVYFGDSVTQGGDIDPDWRWTERFSRHLTAVAAGKTLRFANAAIGGTHSSFGRERFERDVLSHGPDAVTVMFALNDKTMDDRTFEANHRFFVEELRKRGAEPIFFTSNMNTAIWAPGLDHAEQRIVGLCEELDLVCLDAYGIWKGLRAYAVPYESLLSNGINHPDGVAAGVFHELLKRAFFPLESAGASPAADG